MSDSRASQVLNLIESAMDTAGEGRDVVIDEARKRAVKFGKADGKNYGVLVNALSDQEFYKAPFGRQLSDLKAIKAWKEDAKKGYVAAKGKATLAAVRAWVKEKKPSEFYASWKQDSSSYKEDTVEVWYKD